MICPRHSHIITSDLLNFSVFGSVSFGVFVQDMRPGSFHPNTQSHYSVKRMIGAFNTPHIGAGVLLWVYFPSTAVDIVVAAAVIRLVLVPLSVALLVLQ